MDAEVNSISSAVTKEHTSGFGGFALSAPNFFGSKLSSQRHSAANGVDPKLGGEDSNGSSDPDLSLANKVRPADVELIVI